MSELECNGCNKHLRGFEDDDTILYNVVKLQKVVIADLKSDIAILERQMERILFNMQLDHTYGKSQIRPR